MFSKDNKLFNSTLRLRWHCFLRVRMLRNKDFVQQTRQLSPFRVCATPPHRQSQIFQSFQDFNLCFQLRDCSCRRSAVKYLVLEFLHFLVWCFLEIFYVLRIQCGAFVVEKASSTCTALQQLKLTQSTLQPFAPPTQGLIDGFRRGRKTTLQNGQCESNCASLLVVHQSLCPVELLTDVVGDRPI